MKANKINGIVRKMFADVWGGSQGQNGIPLSRMTGGSWEVVVNWFSVQVYPVRLEFPRPARGMTKVRGWVLRWRVDKPRYSLPTGSSSREPRGSIRAFRLVCGYVPTAIKRFGFLPRLGMTKVS